MKVMFYNAYIQSHFDYCCPIWGSSKNTQTIMPCQIGILLSVNSSLTSLGTYSQKTHNTKTKTHLFYDKNNIYIERETPSLGKY